MNEKREKKNNKKIMSSAGVVINALKVSIWHIISTQINQLQIGENDLQNAID